MRIDHVYVLEGKKQIDSFMGVEGDTLIFTEYSGNYTGNTASPWKKSFAEKLLDRALNKAAETIKAEKELFRLQKSEITDINITSIDPQKVAGYITYSVMISFNHSGKSYTLSYADTEESKVTAFESVFK